MKDAMQWERYFDFLADDVIRIKGTRVGVERVIEGGRSAGLV